MSSVYFSQINFFKTNTKNFPKTTFWKQQQKFTRALVDRIHRRDLRRQLDAPRAKSTRPTRHARVNISEYEAPPQAPRPLAWESSMRFLRSTIGFADCSTQRQLSIVHWHSFPHNYKRQAIVQLQWQCTFVAFFCSRTWPRVYVMLFILYYYYWQ